MSNATYPVLPGLTFGVKRTPMFKTRIDETSNGREFRYPLMVYPRVRMSLQYSVLKDRDAADEFRTLMGFFLQRKGAFDTFLLDDPDDNTATNQVVGVGGGGVTTFQLVRSFGGFVEPVYDIKPGEAIKLNGVTQAGSAYDMTADGKVVFDTAPGSGVSVSWTGEFYRRTRFLDDEADFEKVAYQLWAAGRIELITCKP